MVEDIPADLGCTAIDVAGTVAGVAEAFTHVPALAKPYDARRAAPSEPTSTP